MRLRSLTSISPPHGTHPGDLVRPLRDSAGSCMSADRAPVSPATSNCHNRQFPDRHRPVQHRGCRLRSSPTVVAELPDQHWVDLLIRSSGTRIRINRLACYTRRYVHVKAAIDRLSLSAQYKCSSARYFVVFDTFTPSNCRYGCGRVDHLRTRCASHSQPRRVTATTPNAPSRPTIATQPHVLSEYSLRRILGRAVNPSRATTGERLAQQTTERLSITNIYLINR
jgi:hypothetical protein